MRARSPGVVTGAATSLWFVVVLTLLASGCVAPADEVVGAETGDRGDTSPEVTDPSGPADPLLELRSTPEPIGPLRLVTIGDAATDPVQASPANPADVAVVDLLYDGLTALG